MCCRCPPFTTIVLYALSSVLVSSFYSHKALEVDNDFGLISIISCHGSASEESGSFLINLALKRVSGGVQALAGNVSMGFVIDRNVRISLEGLSSGKPKRLIKDRSVCKIIENYAMADEICPIPPGFYKIGPLLLDIDLPREMWTARKFRLEILKDDKILACKIFHLENLKLNNFF